MSTEAQTSTKRTVRGSCHCKYIQYEAKIPTDYRSFKRCNCTMCQKPGLVALNLDSEGSDFTLLSPSTTSQVKTYQAKNPNAYRYFCDRCGVQVWATAEYDANGKHFKVFYINLNTIDQPQEGFDVSELKCEGYVDGLTNNWFAGVGEKPFPGGIA